MAENGYRFEPLHRKGPLLGLGWPQLAVLALCALSAVSFLRAWPSAVGVVAALAVLALGGMACGSRAGRPLLGWGLVVARYCARSRDARGGPPASTAMVQGEGAERRVVLVHRRAPRPLEGLASDVEVVEVGGDAQGGPLGAVWDRGQGTLAAVLSTTGPGFSLEDRVDQERRLAAWAGVLESVGGSGSGLARLQWCQRARQDDGGDLLRRVLEGGRPGAAGCPGPPLLDQLRQDQRRLLELVARDAWRHESLLVVAVPCPGRRPALVERAGRALRTQVGGLRSQLLATGLYCDGPLGAATMAAALRSGLGSGAVGPPGRLAVREAWSAVAVGELWHRTFWVGEWPLSHVAPDFLSPLLSAPGARSFSVVMRPLPAERAARDAESSRTSQLADAQLRAQGGFLETARQRRRAEAVEGREADLADGRVAFEFAGYVSLSAQGEAALEEASAELVGSAARAGLRLYPLYGQQAAALTWTLPLGRGL